MGKGIFISLIILMLSLTFVYAEEVSNETDMTTQVEVTVNTQENINATIVENAEGNIHTDIYCNGKTCNTNLYGDLNIPDGQQVNITQYQSFSQTVINHGSNGGLSISGLISNLGRVMVDYVSGKRYSSDAMDLWSLLDQVFVSHKEGKSLYMNMDYLALERDRLVAENKIMKAMLNITIPDKIWECQAAVETSKRTGVQITTVSGMLADYKVFGEACITITPKSTPIFTPFNLTPVAGGGPSQK